MGFEHDESKLIAVSSEVDTGSREETRQNKRLEPGSDSIKTGLRRARTSSRNVTASAENPLQCKNPLAIMWTERFAVIPWTSNEVSRGKSQEWVQLNAEWYTMPAFTFEKISSPLRRAQNALTEKEQRRSVIVRILNRFGRSRGDESGANDEAASAELESK